MKRLALSILLAACYLTLSPVLAHAQAMMCGKRSEITTVLEKNLESPAFIGLSMDGTMTQLWFSPDKRGYTVIKIPPKGDVACVLDMGGDGQFEAPKVGSPM